ncbi:histidine phosphatase family protein [Ruixingdingia sedimenti]|uniref:Histidine phosphatase family protein n=1 Tax=Ruixingdingia sedimenti TaxID=3073604 RepID=A0ABU1F9X3_9RHOB|nr:histidine phosphatase family protein [Xinfangfangia sp. LG-4]MDR5653688.1 histidine phosphatase family protein [Xinfangfangia sp. LG-4]
MPTPPTRFWWLRHGPTHAPGVIGWSDLPADLSDRGRLARLDAALPADAVLVSSDLRRAVATADAVQARRTRLPHDPALRELHFGTWETLTREEIAARDAAALSAFWGTPGDVPAPGGESWNQLAARVAAATDRLAALHPGRDIVVVAHLGVIVSAIARATGLPPAQAMRQPLDNLSLTETTLTAGRWQAGRINHLP